MHPITHPTLVLLALLLACMAVVLVTRKRLERDPVWRWRYWFDGRTWYRTDFKDNRPQRTVVVFGPPHLPRRGGRR